MNEYPLCLYKEGSELEWHGHSLDMRIVADAEEEAESGKDGWQRIEDLLLAPKPKAKPKAEAK